MDRSTLIAREQKARERIGRALRALCGAHGMEYSEGNARVARDLTPEHRLFELEAIGDNLHALCTELEVEVPDPGPVLMGGTSFAKPKEAPGPDAKQAPVANPLAESDPELAATLMAGHNFAEKPAPEASEAGAVLETDPASPIPGVVSETTEPPAEPPTEAPAEPPTEAPAATEETAAGGEETLDDRPTPETLGEGNG